MTSEHKALSILMVCVMLATVGGSWAVAYSESHKQVPCKCQVAP